MPDKKTEAMTCEEVDKLFEGDNYSVKEWMRRERIAEAHILGCPGCSTKYDTMATTMRDLKQKGS